MATVDPTTNDVVIRKPLQKYLVEINGVQATVWLDTPPFPGGTVPFMGKPREVLQTAPWDVLGEHTVLITLAP